MAPGNEPPGRLTFHFLMHSVTLLRLINGVMAAMMTVLCSIYLFTGQGASGILNTACGVLEGIDLFGNDIGEGVKTDSPKECCELCGRTDGRILCALAVFRTIKVYHFK